MADDPKFLLGFGERLTEPVPPPKREMNKTDPYTVSAARSRLVPMVAKAVEELDSIPDEACPNDEAVAVLTLHPEFLAKSYFPGVLLQELELTAVGSRPVSVKPEKTTRKKVREGAEPSTELFVAGPRDAFRAWSTELSGWADDRKGAADLTKLESVASFPAHAKLKGITGYEQRPLLEVALHASTGDVLRSFARYADSLGAEADLRRVFRASGLCFLPVRADASRLEELARFSFLRVARSMPRIRVLQPVVRSWAAPKAFRVELPTEGAVDPGLRVAVFDGGVGSGSNLETWVTSLEGASVGEPVDVYLRHGAAVTSALLFGPLTSGRPPERPYARVDHYRVLDAESGKQDGLPDVDMYDVLRRIETVLSGKQYAFANFSIGPDEPIEDDDVHGWTAVIDELLSEGDTLAAVAVGNGGDRALDYNRIQVPADSVNALSVGSADVSGDGWRRAVYSSVGPGRSPGVVKPDLLAFGGSEREPFWVLDDEEPEPQVRPEAGTSFASPATLRLATGLRAHFGSLLGPLAIKALLVHCSQGGGERHEAGWGRVPNDLEDFVVCPDGTARIVYQGELTAGQFLRARVPLPSEQLPGMVSITATLCYATKVDSNHPGSYTRAGVGIVFRPHSEKFSAKSEDPTNPVTDSFFQLKEFSTEKELRHDAHKWETTLHRSKNKRGSSLFEPTFDIHYNAREQSAATNRADKVRYALIISVTCKNAKDLYDQVVRAFPTQIRPLQPVVKIPVRTRS
ncbi:MAG: S8 family peptidase [Planctomycetota bacterium]